MTHPSRCPTNHRNRTEDGVKVVKIGVRNRMVYVLSTCPDCGQRFEQPFNAWEQGRPRPVSDSDRVPPSS